MQKNTVWAAATVLAVAALAGLLSFAPAPVAQAQNAQGAQGAATGSRGEYIVHHVAMCVQCHSPRDRQGDLIESKLLQGARIPVKSPWRDMWALAAPQIAGLPGFTDEQVITLLMTGRRPDGETPMSPMPSFRMNRADASAVVSYLRSLGARQVPVPKDPAEGLNMRRGGDDRNVTPVEPGGETETGGAGVDEPPGR